MHVFSFLKCKTHDNGTTMYESIKEYRFTVFVSTKHVGTSC